MAVREQIDSIIAARKQKGENLKTRKEEMQRIKTLLKDSYSKLAVQAREITDDKLKAQYATVLGSIDMRAAQRAIDQLITNLDDGMRRFSRDYISIATIGKERQGKSQFLQSIGNLDNNIIPAYDATSCTGATSVIWNDPKMPKGSVRAVITFRQPHDLEEIVKPYIQTLDPDYLNDNPITFEDIAYINVTLLSMKMEQGNADQATALKHLSNIVDHFDEIRELFGASPLTLTDANLIKTYVAQNNGKDLSDPEVEYYYKYLAVVRADIYCPFYTDTGKVRLVDTVGLGATQFGIEEDMLNTVDKECDAAIVVTRPNSGIQQIDIALYNSLRERFKGRDTSKWLFYLVNHFKGQNDNVVTAFYEDIVKSKWAIADIKIVDNSDQDQVRDDFVMPMLNTLLANMEEIDGAYLKSIDLKEKNVRTEIRKFLDKLPKMEEINTEGLAGKEAHKKGIECFNRMTADLSQIVYNWSLERNNSNSALWNSVQHILNDLENIVPSAEQIDEISRKNGSLLGEDVWVMMLHYVRNEITDRFIAIDNVLEEETRQFKNSLVHTLYHELRRLSATPEEIAAQGDAEEEEEDEDADMVEWLKKMMDEVLKDNDEYKQIRKAFNFLYQFNFNTRAQLIQEVRRQMYIINPICQEYAKPTVNFHKQDCGNAIHFYLTSRMSVIEDELRYHLSKLYSTPNLAFYAAAEEFYDRLTFASDLSGDYIVSMSDVWGSFFQEYSSKIFKMDSARYEQVNKLVEIYNEMIVSLEAFLGTGGKGA